MITELNENDNSISTGTTITSLNPPTTGVDAAVTIEGTEWLDATRVRIRYKFANKGSVPITSLKAKHGFAGGFQGVWNRTDSIQPGNSVTLGAVYSTTWIGVTLPAMYSIEIVAVNGSPDAVTSNNIASMEIKK